MRTSLTELIDFRQAWGSHLSALQGVKKMAPPDQFLSIRPFLQHFLKVLVLSQQN